MANRPRIQLPCSLTAEDHKLLTRDMATIGHSARRAVSCGSGLAKNGVKSFVVSLERSVGARQGVDQHLSERGSFDMDVYPDLPIDTDWRSYFGRLLTQCVSFSSLNTGSKM